MAQDLTYLPGTKKKSGFTWIVLILIVLVVLWYLHNAGYISLPFL